MLFDAHADILTDMYEQHVKGNSPSFAKRHLQEYKRAGITHSIFVNWTNPLTTNLQKFNDIFEHAFAELQSSDDIFHICKTANDITQATASGKIGVIIGMEGIKQLRDKDHLIELYNKGVRHASLTWNEVNKYAGGLDSTTIGLSDAGKEIVRTMESLGMIIDLAHSNTVTFQDVLHHTSGPIIISHGNTKAICSHRRNYSDDQLRQIQQRDGVIGICGIASFIANNKEYQTAAHMAKHIDHAVSIMGIDHVGVGFDVCYYLSDGETSTNVQGFETIGDANNIFEELKLLGYNTSDIQKIKYKNFTRVIQKILQ